MKQIFILGQNNSGIKEIGKELKGWGIKEVEMDDISRDMLKHIQEKTSSGKLVTLARVEKEFANKIKERLQGEFFVADNWSIKTHRIYKRYCDPIFIIVFRNPIDLAIELEQQVGNFEQALDLVIQEENLLIEATGILEGDRIYVSWDEYLRDKDGVLKNIKDFIK